MNWWGVLYIVLGGLFVCALLWVIYKAMKEGGDL